MNTKQRLSIIYGEKADFKIENIENNTIFTQLKIPIKKGDKSDQ